MTILSQVSEYFTDSEFIGREDEVTAASDQIFQKLDTFRKLLQQPIHPSPVPGSLARFTGSKTSQHYAVDRYASAIDVFCEGGIYRAWQLATMSGIFGGVGIYPYTEYQGKKWPMLHLDIRPGVFTTIWARDSIGDYLYPMNPAHRKQFYTCLAQIF